MSFITYKIVVHPTTFESLLMEMTVPETEDEMPLGKRQMTSEEAEAKWSREEFINEMSQYGYGSAALMYIKEHSIYNELKHLLNLVNKVTAYHRHGNPVPTKVLDELSNAQLDYEQSQNND